MLEFLGFTKKTAVQNGLGVYVKSNTGSTIYVELDRGWDIKNIKQRVAPQLGLKVDEVKIIFAGKELLDNVTINECDLGEKSTLHAVITRRKISKKVSTINPPIGEDEEHDAFRPLSESLLEHETEALSPEPGDDHHTNDHLKSHFYVYCTSCDDLKKGKLRVRCSICKGGAFTVHQDPESWQDVLKPNKIRGHCECLEIACCEPDGSPPFTEFFFKCAEHTSEGEKDFSVPLTLIKTNVNRIPCLACSEIEDLVLVFPCSVGHVTCLDCFRNFLRSRLLERNFIVDPEIGFTVNCPVGCENSTIEEIHHFKLLSKDEYERYQRFATEEFVLSSGGVLCPQPGCGMGLLVEDPECTRIQCQSGCGFVFCKNCLQGFHLGECIRDDQPSSCGQAATAEGIYSFDPNRASHSSWDDASKTTIKILTKPCPQCRTPTERDGGCMHMVCTRSGCGFDWCWICQIKWSTDCMGAHWFG